MVISNINEQGKAETTSSTLSSTQSSKGAKGGKTSNSTLSVDEFLNLMVAEMENQDPLEPTDNTQYMAQMATFSQVEATTQMLDKVKSQFAAELVGKNVVVKTDLNSLGVADGTVDYYEVIDGKTYLSIGGKEYDIDDLQAVMEDGYYKEWSKPSAPTT